MNTNRPLTLIAELTYRCPLRCPYCSNPVNYGEAVAVEGFPDIGKLLNPKGESNRQELSTQYWLDAIGQAAKLGILQLGFTGGEPLLRKDLEVMVETAASTGIYTSLITSGTTLTPERAAKLKDCGLDHVQISIQDSQATQSDYIAGVASFEKK